MDIPNHGKVLKFVGGSLDPCTRNVHCPLMRIVVIQYIILNSLLCGVYIHQIT